MRPTRPKKGHNVPGTRPNVLLSLFSKDHNKIDPTSSLLSMLLSTKKKMILMRYYLHKLEKRRNQQAVSSITQYDNHKNISCFQPSCWTQQSQLWLFGTEKQNQWCSRSTRHALQSWRRLHSYRIQWV